MKTIKKSNFLFTTLLPLLLVFLMACSKDEKEGPDPSLDLGEITFTTTGDVKGTFKGMSDFNLYETIVNKWSISGHDINPQTFDIDIGFTKVREKAERPKPGTYSIGGPAEEDFTVNFIYFGEKKQGSGLELSSIHSKKGEGARGTLTITSSNEKTVKGHFECKVYEELYDETKGYYIGKSVSIEGKFTANQRKK